MKGFIEKVIYYGAHLAVAAFAMMAGAACYHQWLMAHPQPKEVQIKEVVIYETYDTICEECTPPAIEETEIEEFCDELEFMAICVEAEAGNQGLEGKRMVADVILNRVFDKDFPNTITEVITQPYQFAVYWDGSMERIEEPSEETIKAVQMELEDRGWPGLFYFTAEGYSKYGTPWKKVGDHYFSTK